MVQSALRAYNASSQLVSTVKGTFVEIPNARKVMRVGMVDLFWLNGMETQDFPLAKTLTILAQDQQCRELFFMLDTS